MMNQFTNQCLHRGINLALDDSQRQKSTRIITNNLAMDIIVKIFCCIIHHRAKLPSHICITEGTNSHITSLRLALVRLFLFPMK